MKTLRNTLIIVLVASSLGLVNLFAEKKMGKVKTSSTLSALDPKAEKIRRVSEEALRDVIEGIVNQVKTDQIGKVNIIFKVSENKRVEVLNVFGYNPQLVTIVKQAVRETAIMVPEAIEGKYMITVIF